MLRSNAILIITLATFTMKAVWFVPLPTVPQVQQAASATPAPAATRIEQAGPNIAPPKRQPLSLAPSPPLPKAAPATPESPRTHPNYLYRALLTSNDPLRPIQWHLDRIGAPAAWDISTGSSTVTVAVIDTGFNFTHEDLAGHWATNPGEMGPTTLEGPVPNCTSRGLVLDKSCNNRDNDGDGFASNWRGWDFANDDNASDTGSTNPNGNSVSHGTMVAGAIGAGLNNAIGTAGVSSGVKIMPLQALNDDGLGYTDAVAAAIRYAADHGAKVINMSLGTDYDDSVLKAEIDYAISQGVTIVAAAGNDGCNCIVFPARYESVIAVGASDKNNLRTSFSSYGPALDLVAPGTDICSTSFSAASSTNSYSCGAGTSFAAPLVSGAVALLLSRRPGSSPSTISYYLRTSAEKVAAMGSDSVSLGYGSGLLSAVKLLLAGTIPTSFTVTKTNLGNLSQADQQDISSTCDTLAYSRCNFSLINDAGVTVQLGEKIADRWGSATLYWSPVMAGIDPGNWTLRATSLPFSETTFEATFTLSP